MNGIHLLILFMAKKINGERSLAGCYHILTGKKSVQAIQDANMYGFFSWYGLFPDWSRAHFDQEVSKLVDLGLLVASREGFLLSKGTQDRLEVEMQIFDFEKRAFLAREIPWTGREIVRFSKLFHLLSQVISFHLSKERWYQPIVQDVDIQLAIKQFWQDIHERTSFINRFRQEVYVFLEELEDDVLASILVERLSGYQVHGRSFRQIADRLNWPEAIVRLYYYQALGLLLQHSINQSSVLHGLTKVLKSSATVLTKSAQKTYELLQKGFDLEQISALRQLKLPTIEDHVIEIAAFEQQFDPSPYLSKAQMEKIIKVSKQLNSRKLSLLKEHLPPEISYFQIRLTLVLDKWNEERYTIDEHNYV